MQNQHELWNSGISYEECGKNLCQIIQNRKNHAGADCNPRLVAKRFQRNAAFAAASRALVGAQEIPCRKAKLETAILKAKRVGIGSLNDLEQINDNKMYQNVLSEI